MTMPRMIIARGRERSLLRRHPWIFSGAVREISGNPAPGETVEVADHSGKVIALAAFSPNSQLTGRVWSFETEGAIDIEFFRRRIRNAAELRKELQLDDPQGGCRLVYSEADGLPGVIVDVYAGFAVLQLLSAGAELHRPEIVAALMELDGIRGVFERSDASVRKREGLEISVGHLAGELAGNITIIENGLEFQVDPRHGQKTGFYFDLRDARKRLRDFVRGKRVLNMFS